MVAVAALDEGGRLRAAGLDRPGLPGGDPAEPCRLGPGGVGDHRRRPLPGPGDDLAERLVHRPKLAAELLEADDVDPLVGHGQAAEDCPLVRTAVIAAASDVDDVTVNGRLTM